MPYKDYPAPMIFYKANKAGFLRGVTPDIELWKTWEFVAISDKDKNDAFERKFGFKMTAKFRHVPESFCRLLLKIGYGQVLWDLELDDFDAFCVPYILGSKSSPCHLVGGSFELPPIVPDKGYMLTTIPFGTLQKIYLIVEIRLYCNNSTPLYHVVVGSVSGAAKVLQVIHKFASSLMQITVAPAIEEARALAGQRHWMPDVWPLPDLP